MFQVRNHGYFKILNFYIFLILLLILLFLFRYAHGNGCPRHRDACRVAAASGQLHCLRYVLSAPLLSLPVSRSSSKGIVFLPLPIFSFLDRFAHENGYPWGGDTCVAAFERGDLDCLKYVQFFINLIFQIIYSFLIYLYFSLFQVCT